MRLYNHLWRYTICFLRLLNISAVFRFWLNSMFVIRLATAVRFKWSVKVQ